MLAEFQYTSMEEFCNSAGVNLAALDQSIAINYDEIGVSTLISVFCTPNLNFEAKHVQDTYVKLGVQLLHAIKIYKFLT
jgi:hypothetical protein